VLDDHVSLLQGWAMVNNVSQEDWDGVQLTLATGAPMSYALDLHTPEFARRPDATGKLVAPTITGVVDSEKTVYADRDGDGIADVDDKCPDEAETYNGYDDNDGCPDRGRVIVSSTSIEVLEQVYFKRGSDSLAGPSQPIVDAIAATLRGNPDIRKVEIGGHASDDEGDPWGMAMRRASAVRTSLVQHGIDGNRLVVVPYGATRPLDDGDSEAAREKNRRVDFRIAQRGKAPSAQHTAPPSYDARAAQTAVHSSSKPVSVAGSVRYVLGEPVTIRRGDRIAQMVIAPVTHVRVVEVEQLDETQRGTGGFGSTGKH